MVRNGTEKLNEIGIVLVDMPRMSREIFRRVIELQGDMTFLGEFPATTDLVSTIETTGARFVVTDLGTATPGEIARLLRANLQVWVLGIADDGRQSFLFELRPHRVPLGEASPQNLLDAIRTVTNVPATEPVG